MNSRGVELDDVQNLLNYRLWRKERCADVYSKLIIRSLKSIKHQEVWGRECSERLYISCEAKRNLLILNFPGNARPLVLLTEVG